MDAAFRYPLLPAAATRFVGTYQVWTETTTTPQGDPAIRSHDAVLVVGARHARTTSGKPLDPEHFELIQFFMDRGDGTMRWSQPMHFPAPEERPGVKGYLDAIRIVRLDQHAGGINLSPFESVNHALDTTTLDTLDPNAPSHGAYVMLHRLRGAPFQSSRDLTRAIQDAMREDTRRNNTEKD